MTSKKYIEIRIPFKTEEVLENGTTEQVISFRKEKLCVEPGKSLYELILEHTGLFLRGCTRGVCGKCKVRFVGGQTIPSAADRQHFTPEELRNGYRLACKSFVKTDAVVEIHFPMEKQIEIVTKNTMPQEQPENKKKESQEDQTKDQCVKINQELVIVVDVGTTTVAMQLRETLKGSILQEYAFLNPQVAYGTDVMSRLTRAREGQQENMAKLLLKQLEKGKEVLLGAIKTEERSVKMFVAGNTTMMHILFQFPVETLSVYPFQPYTLQYCEKDFEVDGKLLQICGLPGFSAFVGADLTADLMTILKENRKESFLLIDLGTNAEMILSDGERYASTAAAAGSTFTGGTKGKVLGTDLIKACAFLKKKGYMDETGLLCEPFFTEGYAIENDRITQKDIREIQKAKSAISVGIWALCKQMNMKYEDISKVYIAGGFGQFLEVEDAVDIKMIPCSLQGKVQSVGNIVLEGVYQYAKDSIGSQKRYQEILGRMEVINLAEWDGFEKKYLEEMNFSE